MAVTKILAKDARLDKLIRYVVNPRKTGEQVFVSSVGCVPETAARTSYSDLPQYVKKRATMNGEYTAEQLKKFRLMNLK